MTTSPAQLDIEVPEMLIGDLRTAGHIARTESSALTMLTGGVSNRTVLVQRGNGEAWVIKQALENCGSLWIGLAAPSVCIGKTRACVPWPLSYRLV